MTGQVLGLEEFVAGLHEPSLDLKVDSPLALLKWDVDLLPVDRSGAAPPTPSTSNCEVAIQPSTLLLKRPMSSEDCNHCSLAPLEDLDDNLDLDDGKDPSEAKRQKRMRRNRESAAMSRERKKAYIEQLESKLSELSQMAATLRTENDALRTGRAPLEGSAPVLVPTSTLMPAPAELAESLLLMPCLQSSDNDSESNDGTDSYTLEVYSSLEVFSQEPPSSLTLPAEPAALFRDASFDS